MTAACQWNELGSCQADSCGQSTQSGDCGARTSKMGLWEVRGLPAATGACLLARNLSWFRGSISGTAQRRPVPKPRQLFVASDVVDNPTAAAFGSSPALTPDTAQSRQIRCHTLKSSALSQALALLRCLQVLSASAIRSGFWLLKRQIFTWPACIGPHSRSSLPPAAYLRPIVAWSLGCKISAELPRLLQCPAHKPRARAQRTADVFRNAFGPLTYQGVELLGSISE